jgi:electron transfer flavoprotein alpha subunit
MAQEIWVLAEQWKGQISDITYELLALGDELATALGVNLQAVLLGKQVKQLAQSLGKASSVLYVEHDALDAPVPETFAQALASMVRARNPQLVLIPLTNVTFELGSLLAAKLDVPYVNSCKNARLVDGKLRTRSVVYGGKMEALVNPPQPLAILGILPGSRPADQGRAEKAPAVEEARVDALETPAIRLRGYIEPEAGDIDINKQDVLVSVGRGLQNKDNLALAEALAATLGGAVCGSRPVIDQGWLPLSRQVGKSGAVVKPKLYLAAGISGAPEHVEGMKNSDLIFAVNTDPQAPIFNVAHYGATIDVMDLLPALTEAVRSRKEAKSHA